MKVLAIDTTTKDLVVALITEDGVLDNTQRNIGTHHSERLCGAVTQLLESANVSFAELDAYACAIGPGSFTGIRIGVSTVKGYATACDKPLLAVNCLQAIACSKSLGNVGSAFVDAGNGYYYADFVGGIQPCLVPYSFAEQTPNTPVAALASEYFDGFVDVVRDKFSRGQFDDDLEPLYIRKSQAEENKK